jgi:hypothetical protein
VVPADQPMSPLPVVVRPIARDDLPLLERHVDQDFGNRAKHRQRMENGSPPTALPELAEL